MTIGAGSRVFLDTNIPLYASFPDQSLHRIARGRLQQLEREGCLFTLSRQVIREFLAVAGRPGTIVPAPSPQALTETVKDWLVRFEILEDDRAVTGLLLELVERPGAKGRQVHDANIVATVRRHSVEYLLTHNTSDFDRYRAWITVLPMVP